jgi:S-DNA-T family DNA segregation ATPase FtsK/SpoIIIE
MTARTRPRPSRAAPPRKSAASSWRKSPLFRPEALGIAIVALSLAVLPWLIDLGSVVSQARDWVARTFGLGILVLALLSSLGGLAISRRAYARDQRRFARQAAGAVILGLFAWGTLGLNEADWTLGSVDFREETLGGLIGRTIVGGPLGLLTWLSLLILSLALLVPGPTHAFARSAPRWAAIAWERRYPHRFFAGIGRAITFLFHRPENADDTFVIGGPVVEAARLQPRPVPTFESTPMRFRPQLDPAAPTSVVGAGAAAAFAPPAALPSPAGEDWGGGPLPFDPDPEPGEPVAARKGARTGLRNRMELVEVPGSNHTIIKNGWTLPDIAMLNAPMISASRKHDNAARAQLIVDTLASFGVDATVVEINEGPTVTQFGVEPGWEVKYREVQLRDQSGKTQTTIDGRPRMERTEVGRTRVRVNRITALQNDLALALAAPSLRIEAPVPGRAIVGIEVPNDSATVVTMRTVMETPEFRELEAKSKLALALGKGVSGVPVVADLARMPHLLIAGATGSGKSVCMNAIIAGIMINATPDEVRFVMIDPKRVELTAYSKIPHLAFSEVIVDMDKVVGTLQAVVAEMEARYKKFAAVAVRNIESYNKHPTVLKKVPYWVVIIDELADLMMAAPFEVEKLLCRLAQLARATGIHLVVATQRPSVDVVTGLIKANFPTRIAFAVTSMTDSRTILDMGGAEKLLGRGDMLYMPTDAAKPIRIQGVYLSDGEVERLVEFWTDDRFSSLVPDTADALLEQALIERNGGEDDFEVEEDDPILDRARQLAMEHQRISPSLLQRRLRVGLMKASKILDLLEDEGLVGPQEDGDSRRVLVSASSVLD